MGSKMVVRYKFMGSEWVILQRKMSNEPIIIHLIVEGQAEGWESSRKE